MTEKKNLYYNRVDSHLQEINKENLEELNSLIVSPSLIGDQLMIKWYSKISPLFHESVTIECVFQNHIAELLQCRKLEPISRGSNLQVWCKANNMHV